MAENNLHQKSSNVTAIGQASIKRPARKVKAMAVIAAPAIVITQDENALLGYFRATDARRKGEFLIMMTAAAKRFPHLAAPALRLIIGGAATPARQ